MKSGKSTEKQKINSNLLNNITFRQAEEKDTDFLVEAIIESEKSGTQAISTCSIFGFSEDEYKSILKDILNKDNGSCEYNISGFLIAEYNGEPAGTYNAWIEGAEEITSGILKSTLLTPYLGTNRIKELQKNRDYILSLSITRETGCLQLEYLYIRNKFRGSGLAQAIIIEIIRRNSAAFSFDKVQTILFNDNLPSFCVHLKLGFETGQIKVADHLNVLNFYPYSSKVLMQLTKEKITHL